MIFAHLRWTSTCFQKFFFYIKLCLKRLCLAIRGNMYALMKSQFAIHSFGNVGKKTFCRKRTTISIWLIFVIDEKKSGVFVLKLETFTLQMVASIFSKIAEAFPTHTMLCISSMRFAIRFERRIVGATSNLATELRLNGYRQHQCIFHCQSECAPRL